MANVRKMHSWKRICAAACQLRPTGHLRRGNNLSNDDSAWQRNPALAIRLNVVQPGCSRSVSIDVRCCSERVLRPGPGLADGVVIATFPSQRPSLGNVIEGRVFREGRGDLSGVRAGESLAEGPPFGQRFGASLAAHRSTRGPKKRPRGSATAWPRHWGRVRAAARSTPSNPAGGPQA